MSGDTQITAERRHSLGQNELSPSHACDAGVLQIKQNLSVLTEEEGAHIGNVLDTLAGEVRRRRLTMYQYFKDYDRSKGYSRIITRNQFCRVLHFLSLNVAPDDLNLICRKFADPSTGDIIYPAFVKSVDRGPNSNTEESYKDVAVTSRTCQHYWPAEPLTLNDVSVDGVMKRIRHHVFTTIRQRVGAFFQEFDPLGSGVITVSQFMRGLHLMGLSSSSSSLPSNLTERHFRVLTDHYADRSTADHVRWRSFTDDVEKVFSQQEQSETRRQHDTFQTSRQGAQDWPDATNHLNDAADQLMERLRQRALQRRVLAVPIFKDFDRHNNGHVTRVQFRQCLKMLEMQCTEPEMQALETRYCDVLGLHYLVFLKDLEPEEPVQNLYAERLKLLRLTNDKTLLPERNVAGDLEGVLSKVKTKVYRKRVRVHEFMRGYDKLRTGRMWKINFRRALDLCTFELAESEIAMLEDHYAVPHQADYVYWLRFSDDVESVFTVKNFQRMPLLEEKPFKPPVEWQQNHLTPEEEDLAMKCMHRLAEKVQHYRMQLFPLFEDYDCVHGPRTGTVSKTQFRRVLRQLEMASLVASEKEWVCIEAKFSVEVGGTDEVHYNAFCDCLYKIAHFDTRKP